MTIRPRPHFALCFSPGSELDALAATDHETRSQGPERAEAVHADAVAAR